MGCCLEVGSQIDRQHTWWKDKPNQEDCKDPDGNCLAHKLIVSWIVDHKRIRGRRTANDDAIHGVRLMLRTLDVAVLLVVERGQRENGHPSPLAVTNPVDKEKR